jgi:hypothetical protein
MDPTVGMFAGFIVEPIDVLTMDIHIPMEGIILTPMEEEDTILTPTGDIMPILFREMGLLTNAIVGTKQHERYWVEADQTSYRSSALRPALFPSLSC